jgi:2-polyprenyl-3-methyl-5-hydroxy-6-metoxy-1,4-benzoquinol methylase
MFPLAERNGPGGAAVWEDVPCPLCQQRDEETVLTASAPTDEGRYRLVRCRRCGLAYLNPRPDRRTIGLFYPEEYEEYEGPARIQEGWWSRLRGRLERLVQRAWLGFPPPVNWREQLAAFLVLPLVGGERDSLTALPYRGEGRLLDYGCGAGWYLERMRRRGWNVTGMDFSPHAARRTAERFGIPVLVGTLPHPEVHDESFDVITMGCVLEHVHDPHAVIAAAARALRPDGWLVLVVPNLASWGFRLFGPDWWPLELPRHLLHFTPGTLGRLVRVHGLEIVRQRMLARPGWMRRSMAISRRRGRGPLLRRLLAQAGRLRFIPSLLTRWSVHSQRADCLMLIARRPLSWHGQAHRPAA